MKKLMKTLSLVTALALMTCAMSVAVLAAAEETEGTQEAVTTEAELEADGEDIPADVENDGSEGTIVNNGGTLDNPTTGASSAPAAVLALAGISLAGAVAFARKK